jgi:pyruvate kinase
MQSLQELLGQLDSLLASLDRAEAQHADDIAAVASEHRAGAVNLVHYTALRQQDIRELQNDLLDLGATSLATTEAAVRAKITAARNVVAALTGAPGPWDVDAINDALDEGDRILDGNADAVLGPLRPHAQTRIMVTLPSEAADDPELVASLVAAGMDLARVNCAHDGPEQWLRMIRNVREAGRAAGRQILVSMDVPGPKLRTGPILDGPAVGRTQVTHDEAGTVLAPARIWLTPSESASVPPEAEPPAARPTLAVPVAGDWVSARKVGERIRLRDVRGRRRTFTVAAVGADGVLAEGQRNAYIGDGTILDCDGDVTRVRGMPTTPQRLSLNTGDTLVLTADPAAVDPAAPGPAVIGCTLPEAVAALSPGDSVLLDDGAITARVASVAPGSASLEVVHTKPGGQRLGAEKGINLPDTDLPLPALTPEDDSYLPFIAEHADIVAVSFIRSADDVRHVLERMAAAGAGDRGLVLKIETRQGFESLPSILLAAMAHRRLGVMIARGDLAVEVGFERLSEVPRQILSLCEAGHVPTIWATQVLESLAKTGLPSRAEITDAAAGQRAECVMLNKGPHIVDAITSLDHILNRVGAVQQKTRTLMRRIHSWDGQ